MPNLTKHIRITGELLTNKLEEEDRNGRLVYVVPCKFLAESYSKGNYKGCLMNEGLFEPDDIQKSVKTWNRKPVTLEHPVIYVRWADIDYELDVSASDPEAQLRHSFGAWMTNVERVYDKKKKWYHLSAEVVIDIDTANTTQQGRRAVAAFKTGKPLSSSIGCTATIEWRHDEDNNGDFLYFVRDITGDHNALLLDEEPAHTNEEGTGMNMSAKVDQLRKWSNNGKCLLTHKSIRPNLPIQGKELPHELLELFGMSKSDKESETTVKEQEVALANEGSTEDPSDTSPEVEVVTATEATGVNRRFPGESDVSIVSGDKVTQYTQAEFDKLVEDKVAELIASKEVEAERDDLVEQVVKAELASREIALSFSVGQLKELTKNIKVATPLVTARATEQPTFDASQSFLNPQFNRASKEKSNG